MFKSGNFALIDTLKHWGITFFSGVNGGGIIHVTKLLEPLQNLSQAKDGISRFLTMSEYVAGFIPLGYYLACGKIAGCIVTTGAAIKLASSGLSDAKLQNIPAIYIVALNSTFSIDNAPLQDSSANGMNIVPQLQAELGDGCIVIDNINELEYQLGKIQDLLNDSRPIVIAFHPDILSKFTSIHIPKKEKQKYFSESDVEEFLNKFPVQARHRRVILYVCSEASRYKNIKDLTSKLSEVLHAPTVWSVNGANAIAADNRFGYGYISFGGNDKAMELWRSINAEDIVITLGFDPGEYELNLAKINAGIVWHFTNLPHAYGQKHGEMRHRVMRNYHMVRGDIDLILSKIIPRLQNCKLDSLMPSNLEDALNTRKLSRKVRSDCVDLITFYETLDQLWQPNSIGFDDVCIAYKDRQHISPKPHPNINFYSMHEGSAMGGAFGLGVGAKIGNSSLHTFVFSGDGCWRLYGGALAEAANLDLRLFIMNNMNYEIVKHGLEVIMPEVDGSHYHCALTPIDFVAAAKAHGWDGFRLKPDLSNLEEIMQTCYSHTGQSILIDVPVDVNQQIGLNSRLDNLMIESYL